MKYVTKYVPWLAALVLLGLLAYGIITIRNYLPPSEFTMATGREGGAYDAYGQEYQRLLAERGYTLNLVPTAGSKENLELLRDGQVDVALVQTNTAEEGDAENLVSLASLFYEPLWIFYRQTAENEEIRFISDLAGRDIAIGEAGGGTYDIARFVLSENGVTEDNATFHELPNSEATQQLIDGAIDVAFMISAPESQSVMTLLTEPDIELLSIERVLAYQSRYNKISTVALGEGAVDLARNIPSEDKALLTAVATFVAPRDLSPDLVRLLLTVAEEVHGPGGILEHSGEFPSAKLVEIPMDAGAEAFLENGPTGLERFFPLWVASRLERFLFLLVPFLVLLYPLFRTTPLAVSFFFRFRINRWYRRLRTIELGANQMSVDELNEQSAWLEELEGELAKRLAVPMVYLADVYMLRFQVNRVGQRLRTLRDLKLGKETAPPDGESASSEFANFDLPLSTSEDDTPPAA